MTWFAIQYGHGSDLRASTDEQKIRDAFALIEPELRKGCRVVVLEEVAERDTVRPEAPETWGEDPFAVPRGRLALDAWPSCEVCGKGPREGNHATELGVGHDYVPARRNAVPRAELETIRKGDE